jgi:hypothetical protein
MIPIKIQCECGQRYAFEVEPVGGRLPSPVACPACGADGTAAANAAISQSLAAQPAPAAVGHAPLRVTAPAQSNDPATPTAPARTAARRGATLLPGQVDRTQAKYEARAKVSWGDPPQAVLGYLIVQGFSREEASSLVKELFQERAATVRGNGIKRIVIGCALMCVPVVALSIFLSVGVIHLGVFAVTIILGFWGIWMVIKGIGMVLAPKVEPGDVAEQ